MLEHRLLLFIFAFADLRILPQPDFDWAPPWLAARFAGRGITPEQAWNGLIGAVVLCARETDGAFLVLLGLRIWGRRLCAAHPVARWKLVAPLALSLAGLAVTPGTRWVEVVFMFVLGALIGTSLTLVRGARPTVAAPARNTGAYAVLRQAAELRRGKNR